MPKDTSYTSLSPDVGGRYPYTAADAQVWRTLFDRQMQALPGRAAPEYLNGVGLLGLAADHVPQVVDIDARLGALTGAGVEGVPAIIPPSKFFALLSQRKFPVATFLRRAEHLDYIEEPDLFHEVFGHCPLLTDPAYAAFIESFGALAQEMPKDMRWPMFRLFWFTVEFGLIRSAEGLRAYGAGIVSSPAELENAFSGQAEHRPFDLIEVLRTPYRIDIVQPIYFVIESFEALSQVLTADLPATIREAQALGDLPARFDPAP